jgi:hypothetical protein
MNKWLWIVIGWWWVITYWFINGWWLIIICNIRVILIVVFWLIILVGKEMVILDTVRFWCIEIDKLIGSYLMIIRW